MFLIDLTIHTLFYTNLWIIIYTKLLYLLNLNFPPKIYPSDLGIPSSPEPFEIPLYLTLSFIFIVLIWFFDRSIRTKIKISIPLKISLLLVLSFIFIFQTGSFPVAHEYSPYLPRAENFPYYLLSFLYIGTVFFVILITALISLRLKGNYSSFIIYTFLVLFIALATFDARFPMAGHDYEYFIGPIWEIAKGKTIYVDIPSQYAFLTVEIFSLLYKLRLFSLYYLPFVIWLLYIIQYFICFYLIKNTSRSIILAAIGLVSIMTLNYFSLSHLPSVVPQIGPLRWFPLILSVFLLFKLKRVESFSFIILLSFLSLFTIDAGIALILSFITTLAIYFLGKRVYFVSIIRSILIFASSLISILFLINIFHLLFGYKPINFIGALSSFREHVSLGLTMMPIPSKSYFWFVILIYFFSLIYFFKTRSVNSILLLFTANLSLFAGSYFVGRSHPHNLFNISLFPLLNLFILLGYQWTNIRSKRSKFILSAILFIFLVVYPVSQRKFTLTEMILSKIERLEKGEIFYSEVQEIVRHKYKDDLQLIEKNLKSEETIILSTDDTYLFYESRKKNLLNVNPIRGINQASEIDKAVQSAIQKCPEKIVVDCSFVGKCQPYTPFVGVSFDFKLILNRLEAACNSKFIPEICSNYLCIASKHKI